MPLVTMPDGAVVDMPETLTPELGARLRALDAPKSSTTDVAINAANKGVAALPDMVLNTPNKLLNLGRAAIGSVANAAGRPDLAPELQPDPDLARKALEAVGIIKPNIQPSGGFQRGVDAVTQGVVGGALTGGSSIPQAVVGAGMGGLSNASSFAASEMGASPAVTAMTGLAVPAAAGRVLASAGTKLAPNQQLLRDEGVPLTPGQIKGGEIKRIEDGLAGMPVIGGSIKSAQNRGIESFGVAALNRALEPIGGKIPLGLKGNEALAYTRQKLSDAYDSLLPNLKGDLDATPASNMPAVQGQPQPGSFRQKLDTIRQMGKNLPEAQRKQLEDVIDREVIGEFTPKGLASGETLKNIESLLGTLAKKKANSDNYHENQLGLAIKEIQSSMRDMVNEVNPNYHAELSKINLGYANFKNAQRAGSSVAAPDGVFTPAQLHAAIKVGDRTKDKRAFSEGDALGQDLSAAGKAVLPPSLGDSGTGFRAVLYDLIHHPLKTAAALPGALAYSSIGQRGLQSFLTRNEHPMFSTAGNNVPIVVQGGTLSDILANRQK